MILNKVPNISSPFPTGQRRELYTGCLYLFLTNNLSLETDKLHNNAFFDPRAPSGTKMQLVLLLGPNAEMKKIQILNEPCIRWNSMRVEYMVRHGPYTKGEPMFPWSFCRFRCVLLLTTMLTK